MLLPSSHIESERGAGSFPLAETRLDTGVFFTWHAVSCLSYTTKFKGVPVFIPTEKTLLSPGF